MTPTTTAVAWPRLTMLAFAVLGLALATMPAAHAQEDEEAEFDSLVLCDAEGFEEAGEIVYFVGPGDEVECTASGLEAEVDAEWFVEFFDLFEETDDPVDDDGDTVPAEEDGTLTFGFTVPDDIVLGVFDGYVAQGDEEDGYFEEFFGFILGFAPIECEPEPVLEGGSVTCTAEEMEDGEFEWMVQFLTIDDVFEVFESEEEEFEDDLEPDLFGTGTAVDGIGTFDFDVPVDADIDLYLAVAAQEDYLAVYLGEVEPLDEDEQEDPEAEEEDAAPVVVPRPERVDTGGGGVATSTNGSTGLLLLILVLVAAAVPSVRHRVTRGR